MNRYTFTLLCLLLSFIAGAQAPDGDLQITDLPGSVLSPGRTLLIAGPFDGMAVLRKLFPGRYYDLESSGYKGKLINWSCKSCQRKKYADVNGVEDDPVFPFKEGVATRLITIMDLSDASGGQYKMLAFNHSSYDLDGMQTGRFSGGLLGLAKFTRTEQGWLMRSFNPAIAAYGAFSSCPTPKAVRIGEDQYAFRLEHANGGAGGPYEHSYFLVAGANGRYSQVLAAYGTARSQAAQDQSSWTSELTVPAGNKKYFRDIVIRTSGRYIMADEEDAKISEIHKQMKGFRSCDFSFIRRYVYTAAKGYQAGPVQELVLRNKK